MPRLRRLVSGLSALVRLQFQAGPWDIRWATWHWDRFFSEYFNILSSLSFQWCPCPFIICNQRCIISSRQHPQITHLNTWFITLQSEFLFSSSINSYSLIYLHVEKQTKYTNKLFKNFNLKTAYIISNTTERL